MKTPDILSNPNFRRAFVVAAAVAIANFPQDQAHAEPSDPTPSVIDVSSGSDNSDSPSGRSRDSKKYTPVPSVIPVSGNQPESVSRDEPTPSVIPVEGGRGRADTQPQPPAHVPQPPAPATPPATPPAPAPAPAPAPNENIGAEPPEEPEQVPEPEPTPPTPVAHWIHPFPDLDRCSSDYGNRPGGFHGGIDMVQGPPGASVEGGTIVAAGEGIVKRAGATTDYGSAVVVEHPDGTFTEYGHVQRKSITVKVGQLVKAGEEIAKVGNEGKSTGPHLHFAHAEEFFDDRMNPHESMGARGVDLCP